MRPLPGLEVRPSRIGLGLFATQDFARGQLLARLGGPFVPEEQKPNFQVGAAQYMGPALTAIDAMNHSCDPKAYVEFVPGFPVKAFWPIEAGTEITIDYSISHTTPVDEVFFSCLCGSVICRKNVGGFLTIPDWQRLLYLSLDIVPQYVKDESLSDLLGLVGVEPRP